MESLSTAQKLVKDRYEQYTQDGPFDDQKEHLIAATLILAEELSALRLVVESQVRLQTAKHNLV